MVQHSLEHIPALEFSVSCTTRAPRGEEVDGRDYHFLSPTAFREKIAENAFVEFEEVYPDQYYGTLKAEVERIWARGKVVIFDVDVLGGIALKKYFGSQALSIFIMPPSVAALELRLIARGTDDLETIKIRVAKANEEITYKNEFDRIVINDRLEDAQEETEYLINKFIEA